MSFDILNSGAVVFQASRIHSKSSLLIQFNSTNPNLFNPSLEKYAQETEFLKWMQAIAQAWFRMVMTRMQIGTRGNDFLRGDLNQIPWFVNCMQILKISTLKRISISFFYPD